MKRGEEVDCRDVDDRKGCGEWFLQPGDMRMRVLCRRLGGIDVVFSGYKISEKIWKGRKWYVLCGIIYARGIYGDVAFGISSSFSGVLLLECLGVGHSRVNFSQDRTIVGVERTCNDEKS
jgi:hypothetical protein